jgi:anti-anti-sigma regulatory factor
MEIRIDIKTEGAAVVLHVAGRLTGPAIAQLTEACEPMKGRIVLDLSKLKFADDAGAEAIRTLRERGADIRGASSFIKLLINGEVRQN